jgi:hypothetical protein
MDKYVRFTTADKKQFIIPYRIAALSSFIKGLLDSNMMESNAIISHQNTNK